MLRQARVDDFEVVYTLYMHPDTNPHLLYEWMDQGQFRPIFQKLLSDGVLYVYEHEARVVGMSKLVPLTHRSQHCVYLGGVAILPECAGQGFGRRMLIAVLAYLSERSALRVELSVGMRNHAARALYRSLGFEEIGVLSDYTYLASEQRFIDEMLMQWRHASLKPSERELSV
jgi:L-phenylalanine/L-methionine N-acetyltransferase